MLGLCKIETVDPNFAPQQFLAAHVVEGHFQTHALQQIPKRSEALPSRGCF